MRRRFNPPPDWPEPPHDGWVPPADFRPGHGWSEVPAGWRLWLPAERPTRATPPLQESEDVPASGARPRERVDTYPVTVLNPGMWSHNHLEDEDYGFPPPEPVTRRPRLRLGLTITVTALGFVLAALTAVLFVWLTNFAIEDVPTMNPGVPTTGLHPGTAGIDPSTSPGVTSPDRE